MLSPGSGVIFQQNSRYLTWNILKTSIKPVAVWMVNLTILIHGWISGNQKREVIITDIDGVAIELVFFQWVHWQTWELRRKWSQFRFSWQALHCEKCSSWSWSNSSERVTHDLYWNLLTFRKGAHALKMSQNNSDKRLKFWKITREKCCNREDSWHQFPSHFMTATDVFRSLTWNTIYFKKAIIK